MIATIEKIEILDEAQEISSMILHSELAEEYRSCIYMLQQDREAQKLIADFQRMKEKYEEVQRFGKYHPDFRTVSKETRELKRKLDLHESIANFKTAEDNLQKVLDEISVLLGGAVSKYIKVPTGNPYFDSISSCGGGCGSGGACGCK
ncbi:YlbF family regulator [Fredinandcohnia sp. QZ13]|uniref:YlbF family regulator n=1 Tax=Fredinandcohnia sp. QZ13 TaxID=3073144 RepID=UPI002852F416|nr:YlbF family regulator [Fredinandcohnia sp. QZ13]MDR4886619.1 YlbF family regulator [Fredinandcohnia sp. QZ13]